MERSDVDGRVDIEGENTAAAIEAERCDDTVIAGLRIRLHGLAAGRDPAHRPADGARGGEQCRVFRVTPDLGAESAADIVGQDSQRIRGDAKNANEMSVQDADALARHP